MNTYQLTLFDIPPTTSAGDSDATIEARFDAFHNQNPQVFEALKRICLEMKRQGMRRWSIKAAYENARWLPSLRTSGSTVKLSNDFHSYYSRRLMAEVPELAGFFTTRCLRNEGDE